MRLTRVPQRIGGRRVPFGRTALLVQLVVAIVVFGYAIQGQKIAAPWGDGDWKMQAVFDDAAGLDPGNRPQVMVAGVVVGYVTDIDERDGRAVATLKMDDDKVDGRIFEDATARVTPRSAINDLIVDVDPGTPGRRTLDDGAKLASAGNSGPVGLDRLTQVLDADTQAYAQVLLAEARTGLDGRSEALAGTLKELSTLMDPTTRVAGALADRRRQLSRLVGQLDVVFRTLGRRGEQLREVVRHGEGTLQAAGRQSTALESSMRQLPSTLAATRTGLDSVQRLAGPLVPALSRLRPGARRMPAALRSLRRFVPTGRGLLSDLRTLGRRGSEPAANLDRLLGRLGPAAQGLQGPVDDLTPLVDTLDHYKSGMAPLGDTFSGVFSTNDANGPRLRAYGFFEPVDPRDLGFGTSPSQRAAASTAAVRMLTQVCLKENPVACLARYLVPGLPGVVDGLARPVMERASATTQALTGGTRRAGAPTAALRTAVDDLVDSLGRGTWLEAR